MQQEMDLAPLINAQNTARNATSHEQHEKAALEYSAAAQGVEDSEALRILSLLEHHHQHLARIVKAHASPESAHTPAQDSTASSLISAPVDATPPSPIQQNQPSVSTRHPPSPVLQRKPPRDLSSTIASDLATARGIPAQQQRTPRHSSPVASSRGLDGRLSSRQQKQGAPGSLRSGHPGLEDATQRTPVKSEQAPTTTRTPPQTQSLQSSPPQQNTPAVKDDAFQKFYSTFEGLLSKLSAPLAFAGLPLASDEQSSSAPDKAVASIRSKAQEVTSDGPDVTKLFSKAALRAVKEDNPGFGGIQESFLVVPTGGGTVSYAGILSRQERHARQHSMEQPLDPDEDGTEHFVDAKSSPQSRSPKASRKSSSSVPRSTNKSLEELELENESLKQLTDNLSRRLYMWEKSAQSQSMALQQSIRTLQPPSQVSQEETTEQGADARLRELEEQLASTKKEMQRYERENDKLKTVVARYRERWEKLKEGARVRRDKPPAEGGPQSES